MCLRQIYVFLKRNSIFSPAVDFFVFQDPLSHLCCSPDKNELKEENILIQMKSTRWGNLITGGPGFSPANFKEKWHEGGRMWFFLIVPWRMNLDASVLYCTPWGGLKWVYLPPGRAGIHGQKYPYVFLFLQALSADSLSWVAATVSWEPPWIIQWDLGGPGVRDSGKHGESWGCSPETGLRPRASHEAECSQNQPFIYECWAVSLSLAIPTSCSYTQLQEAKPEGLLTLASLSVARSVYTCQYLNWWIWLYAFPFFFF